MLAFSDGVIAVIITIMVLDLKAPHEATFVALRSVCPGFVTYVVSFIYVGIYWNNHHHMLSMAEKTSGAVLWANLHLLFWLSLVPFVTGWVGETDIAGPPTAVYAFVMMMCGAAYSILQNTIISHQGANSRLKQAVGRDYKGKVSIVIYLAAVGVSFFSPIAAAVLCALPAALWFIPDRRIESRY